MWNLSGKESYRGSGKLTGKRAVITGVDSGIERAVAAELATAYVMLANPLSSYVSEQQSRLPAGSRFCRGADAAHFRCGRHSNFRGRLGRGLVIGWLCRWNPPNGSRVPTNPLMPLKQEAALTARHLPELPPSDRCRNTQEHLALGFAIRACGLPTGSGWDWDSCHYNPPEVRGRVHRRGPRSQATVRVRQHDRKGIEIRRAAVGDRRPRHHTSCRGGIRRRIAGVAAASQEMRLSARCLWRTAAATERAPQKLWARELGDAFA